MVFGVLVSIDAKSNSHKHNNILFTSRIVFLQLTGKLRLIAQYVLATHIQNHTMHDQHDHDNRIIVDSRALIIITIIMIMICLMVIDY